MRRELCERAGRREGPSVRAHYQRGLGGPSFARCSLRAGYPQIDAGYARIPCQPCRKVPHMHELFATHKYKRASYLRVFRGLRNRRTYPRLSVSPNRAHVASSCKRVLRMASLADRGQWRGTKDRARPTGRQAENHGGHILGSPIGGMACTGRPRAVVEHPLQAGRTSWCDVFMQVRSTDGISCGPRPMARHSWQDAICQSASSGERRPCGAATSCGLRPTVRLAAEFRGERSQR